MEEPLCRARRLLCDDADLWPQVHSMYFLGALPPLAVICRSRDAGVSEKFLIRGGVCVSPDRRQYDSERIEALNGETLIQWKRSGRDSRKETGS